MRKAQIAKADQILSGDIVRLKRRHGVFSDKTGESSMMFRGRKALDLGLSNEALACITGYVDFRMQVRRFLPNNKGLLSARVGHTKNGEFTFGPSSLVPVGVTEHLRREAKRVSRRVIGFLTRRDPDEYEVVTLTLGDPND